MEEHRETQGGSGVGGLRWDGELEEGVDVEPKGWKYPKGEGRGGIKGEASGMMGG